jgi:hypothetical protein
MEELLPGAVWLEGWNAGVRVRQSKNQNLEKLEPSIPRITDLTLRLPWR